MLARRWVSVSPRCCFPPPRSAQGTALGHGRNRSTARASPDGIPRERRSGGPRRGELVGSAAQGPGCARPGQELPGHHPEVLHSSCDGCNAGVVLRNERRRRSPRNDQCALRRPLGAGRADASSVGARRSGEKRSTAPTCISGRPARIPPGMQMRITPGARADGTSVAIQVRGDVTAPPDRRSRCRPSRRRSGRLRRFAAGVCDPRTAVAAREPTARCASRTSR